MIGRMARLPALRWLAVLLLSQLWAMMGCAAALAGRSDFSPSAIAAKNAPRVGSAEDLVSDNTRAFMRGERSSPI